MISTFDLTLLGTLVSAGGIVFLRLGKWPHLGSRWLPGHEVKDFRLTSESRENHERSTAIAGTRWLTVGALTFFVAYAHGAEEGYFFGPWSDVMFHVIFVAACWGMTAIRIKQAAERSTTMSLPATSTCRTSD